MILILLMMGMSAKMMKMMAMLNGKIIVMEVRNTKM